MFEHSKGVHMFKVVSVHRREQRMSEWDNVTKIELTPSTGNVAITYGTSDPQLVTNYNNKNYLTYIVESKIDE